MISCIVTKHEGVKCARPGGPSSGSRRGPIGPIMAEVGPAEVCFFEAFSCNVVQSGAIISQQKMMDFYRVIFIFQGMRGGCICRGTGGA